MQPRCLPYEILPCYAEVGKELHSALSKIGFVSLTQHGIDPVTVRSVFDASRRFFEELSSEEKLGYPQTEDKKQGYVSPGKEMLDNLKVGVDHENLSTPTYDTRKDKSNYNTRKATIRRRRSTK